MKLRGVILALAGIGAPLALLVAILPITWGYGGYLTESGLNITPLTYVDPAGPAAKAGLRAGELVVAPRHAEVVMEDSGNVGTVAHIVVVGPKGERHVVSFAFVPFSGTLAVQEQVQKLLSALTALGAFIVAILVVLRARERRAGEFAALVLLLAGLSAFCKGAALVCDNAWLGTLFYWVAPPFFGGAIVWASLRFLAIYPPNATRLRTFFGKASIVALLWAALLCFAFTYDLWNGSGFAVIEVEGAPVALLLAAALIVAIVDGMVSARAAHATPMRWLGSMWLIATVLSMLANLPYLRGHNGDLLDALIVFFLAFGVAYPVLRHRLIDLNILVSRATVFGIASAIIVGLFVVAEWVIGRIFEQSMGFSTARSGFAAQALTLVVVLVLGISARSIHGFVEDRMTKTFFRKRMRGLASIERVAREADAGTDARAIMDVAVNTVQHCLEPLGTALYVTGGSGYDRVSEAGSFTFPQSYGYNDEPALRLRRWQESFELDDESEERHHVLFVPMTLRGTVLGFLCCGPKPDRTAYLGDEIAAVSLLAHHVGIASALLERKQTMPAVALART